MTNQVFATDELAKLIQRKLSVLEQLRDKSRQQAELIQQGETARLIVVLTAKQKLIDELQMTEAELDPFRAEDPDSRVWRSAELRKDTRWKAERCNALLQEALLLDRQAESELATRRDDAAKQLDRMYNASRAVNAYGTGPTASQGKRIDLSS